MSPRSNRVLLAIVFAALWTAGMLWQSAAIDLQAVVLAVIAGAVVGLLIYWVFDKFGGRFRA